MVRDRVAAVEKITRDGWGGNSDGAEWMPREGWQIRAQHFERIIGEFGGAANYMEYAVGQTRFVAGLLDDTGGIEPDEDPMSRKLALMANTMDKGRMARLLFVIAEGYLTIGKTPTGFCFDVWSPTEMQPAAGGFAVRDHPSRPARLLYDQSTPLAARPAVYRVFHGDTEFKGRAFGWAGRCLDNLEALALMTLADKAVSLSRLAGAGILYLPNEAMLPQIAAEDETGRLEPSILDRLTDGMILPIGDRGNPDSLVPIVITGPAEYADAMKHLTFEKVNNPDDFEKRRNVHLRVCATAADLPASKFLNTDSDGQFWNAWQTDKETSKGYVMPYAKKIADAATEWYQHMLRQLGHPSPWRAVLYPDDSQLVTVPDAANIAIKLRTIGLLKADATVEACGFSPDSDMMEVDSEEYRQWVQITQAMQVRTTAREQIGPGGTPTAPGQLPSGSQPPGAPPNTTIGSIEPIGLLPSATEYDRGLADGLAHARAIPATARETATLSSESALAPPAGNPPTTTQSATGQVAATDARPALPIVAAQKAIDAAFRSTVERVQATMNRAVRSALTAAGAKVASTSTKPGIGPEIKARLASVPADARHLTCAIVGRDLVTAAVGDTDLITAALVLLADEVEADLAAGQAIAVLTLDRLFKAAGLDPDSDAYKRTLAERRAAAGAAAYLSARTIAADQLYSTEPTDGNLIPLTVAQDIGRIAAGAKITAGLTEYGSPIIVRSTTDAPVVSFSNDPALLASLRTAGVDVASYTWTANWWGAAAAPFEPHQALDGATFGSWDAPVLANVADSWTGYAFYAPGDHDGCNCWVDVAWVQT